MLKRLLPIFLVLSILLYSFGIFSANASDNQSKFQSNQNVAYENYNTIKEHYKTKYGKDHPENYAGAYLDEEGNLNINLVGDNGIVGESDNDLRILVKDDKIKYHKVKYSLNHLDNIINSLNDKMVSLDIAAIELDEQNNKVYIYLNDLNNTQISKIKKVIDSPAIEFKQQEQKITLTATDLVNGTAFSSAGKSFTLSFGAKKSDGTVGYIFPGHITASTGYNVYIGSSSNGTSIGTVTKKVFGGSSDASFITKVNIDYQPSTKLDIFNSYNGYVPAFYGYIQNTSLRAWGAVSGSQNGKILSSSYSFIVDGVTLTDMVKSDYKAITGDSGAPVCITSGTGSYTLAGTQSSSYLVNGSWVSGTSYSIFSKVNNILTDLGCTPTP